MVNAHVLTMNVGAYSDKWVTDLTKGSNIRWSCGTLCFVCMKSLSYKQYNWVKLNRKMVKNKLKQGNDIYSILLWH